MASNTKEWAGTIRSHFATEWKILRGYTDTELQARLAIEGMALSPPNGEWARLSVLWGDGFPFTMGTENAKNELVGVLSVQVFVRPNEGTGALDRLCDDVRDILNRLELTDADVIRMGVPSPPRPLEDESWVGRVIDVPFTVEETI